MKAGSRTLQLANSVCDCAGALECVLIVCSDVDVVMID